MQAFIDTVLDYDPVRSRVDIACSCVRLLETMSLERAISVARHALNFGNIHHRELKRSVEHHLDESHDAIAAALASNAWGDAQPVFSRTGEDYRERIDVRSAQASDATATKASAPGPGLRLRSRPFLCCGLAQLTSASASAVDNAPTCKGNRSSHGRR